MVRFSLHLVVVLFYVSGCAPVLSDAVLQQGDRDIPFPGLRESPDLYQGKTVILGGTIVRVTNSPSGPSELEVLQRPLGFRLEPELNDRTEGRFIVSREKPFEDLEFKKGRKITLAARVAGRVTRPLDQTEYTYPLLELQEYHLWPEGDGYSGKKFFISIGLGASF